MYNIIICITRVEKNNINSIAPLYKCNNIMRNICSINLVGNKIIDGERMCLFYNNKMNNVCLEWLFMDSCFYDLSLFVKMETDCLAFMGICVINYSYSESISYC